MMTSQTTKSMIDLNSLSKQEILELEKQLQEYKKSEKFLTGYKVTFCVRFNPNMDAHSRHSSLLDAESFGEWLCGVIPVEIIGSFNLKKPEDVSGFEVQDMTEEDMKNWF